MKRRDYFLKALRSGAYCHRIWVLSIFSMTDNDVEQTDWTDSPFPYRLLQRDGKYVFIDLEKNGEFTEISDASVDQPLISPNFALTLTGGDLPNVFETVETTYGEAFFNAMVLVYAFGSKFPYVTGKINIRNIEAVIENKLQDDIAPNSPVLNLPDPDVIYVHEYKRFAEAIFNLPSYNTLWVPSASPKTLTRDPRIPEMRDALNKALGDRVTDPAEVARVEATLIKVDKAWVDDDGKDFYIKEKSYSNSRKKIFLQHGYEKPFSANEEAVTITTSLDEGWDYENLPAMNNSSREGSYMRGSETQLGGVKAKEALRNFQNATIREPDCGDTFGIVEYVRSDEADDMLGFYYLENDKPVLITRENIDSLVNRVIHVRSPSACKTQFTDFCEVCMGAKISQNPLALSAYAQGVGSTFLQTAMKKMHVSSLKLEEYDIDYCIT